MSTVELAIKEVKKLSPTEAKELLTWLGVKRSKGENKRRKDTGYPSMKKLKAWRESVRLTTDWEIPRMPDELVKPFSVSM